MYFADSTGESDNKRKEGRFYELCPYRILSILLTATRDRLVLSAYKVFSLPDKFSGFNKTENHIGTSFVVFNENTENDLADFC